MGVEAECRKGGQIQNTGIITYTGRLQTLNIEMFSLEMTGSFHSTDLE